MNGTALQQMRYNKDTRVLTVEAIMVLITALSGRIKSALVRPRQSMIAPGGAVMDDRISSRMIVCTILLLRVAILISR